MNEVDAQRPAPSPHQGETARREAPAPLSGTEWLVKRARQRTGHEDKRAG
ncbi:MULTISPECIES: hypothetical protein [Actinosynnema]|nr:hypothetical protein [Actinosynnema pretiosum]MCP2095186.1 hypothetical protein [Actinosynnema pretiosum]